MKRDSKFRTFTGILALIIAMGVFPPVVSSADEIETDPTEAMYDAAPVNTVDFADVDESEEAESEVTGLEYETPDEGITDDPDDNTTDEDVPDDSDDTTGEDITDNTDDTTDEDVPDDPDDTTGEDITDNTDDTTDEDVPDDPDDTTGEDITDNTDDTTDEDVPDDPDDTTGEDITDNTDDTIDESITDEDIANDPDDETSDEIIIDDVVLDEEAEEEPEQDEEQSWTTFFEALSEKAAATAEILGIFTESEEVKTALENLTDAVLKIEERVIEDISELFVNYCGEEIQNYAAFDLGFYFGDEEVEPGTEVAVTVDLTEYLADQDYTPESLVLYHHVEDEWGGIVDTVEVASYEDGITVDEETGTVTATFVVDSFSNFTITWKSNNNTTYFEVTVHYVDADGEEISGSQTTSVSASARTTINFEDEYAEDVEGYTYSGAYLDNVNGDEVTSVSFSSSGGRNPTRTMTFYNGNSQVGEKSYSNSTITAEVYLVYEVEKPLVFETVDADPAPGVSVTMYNYSSEINEHGISSTDQYKFYNYQSNSVDGGGDTNNKYGYWGTVTRLPLNPLLTSDGYPDTELHDDVASVDDTLRYLFDDTEIEDGTDTDNADGKVVYDTMSDGGGLFQKEKDENGNWTGYYVYDSQKNAAYFTPEEGFVLYKETIIRPSAQSSDGTDRISDGNFLPFNELRTDTVSTSNVYTYDGSVNAYQLKAPVDLWFGMVIEFEFLMPKDGKVNGESMIFDFHGDDDVMVYIDDRLVLNISGTHQAESGSINFANSTYSVTDMIGDTSGGTFDIFKPKTDAEKELYNEDGSFKDYTVHKLKFFYLERGGSISYCRLRFNMPTLPEKSLTVKKELTDNNGANDDVVSFVKDSLEYKFRVVKEDSTKENVPTNELFIPAGTEYNLLENDVLIGTGTVGEDGYFTLKADQSAQFDNVFQYSDKGKIKYIVQEVMPDNLTGQYNEVGYAVGGGTNSETNIDTETTTDFTAFSTGALPADNSQIVIYRNQVAVEKLSVLKVAKEVLPGSNFADSEKFKFKVELGGEPLEAGTGYKIGNTTYEAEKDGYIYVADGETATIVKGILAGTEYTVTEVGGAGSNADYEVSCVHRVEGENDEYEDVVCDALHHVVTDSSKENNTDGSVSGNIAVNSTVTVTVTNSSYDFGVEIPVTKQFKGNSAVDVPFTFTLTQCEKDGEPITNGVALEKEIAVTGENVSEDEFFVGYDSTAVEVGDSFYYLITETKGNDDTVSYDPSKYIAEVTIQNNSETGKTEAVLASITKIDEEDVTYTAAEFINSCTTSVTITKEVKGNMGDRSKEFTFEAYLTKGTADIDFPAAEDGDNYTVNGKVATFTLAHGESITIDDIPIGATLVVTEVTEKSEGYDVYINDTDRVNNPDDDGKIEHEVTADENLILYTNYKKADIDTAVHLDYLPYIILFAIVGTGVVLAASDKRREADD